jgi:hypothetical protein
MIGRVMDIILKVETLWMIQATFGGNWLTSFKRFLIYVGWIYRHKD